MVDQVLVQESDFIGGKCATTIIKRALHLGQIHFWGYDNFLGKNAGR